MGGKNGKNGCAEITHLFQDGKNTLTQEPPNTYTQHTAVHPALPFSGDGVVLAGAHCHVVAVAGYSLADVQCLSDGSYVSTRDQGVGRETRVVYRGKAGEAHREKREKKPVKF